MGAAEGGGALSIETDVFDRLVAAVPLVANRCYPLLLPQNPTLPAITFQKVSNVREQALPGDSALQHPRYQFSCWALTYGAAWAVAEQVRLAMQGLTAAGGGYYENAVDLYDPETGWYQVAVDMTVWHN